jgi:hypothetical protein
MEIIIDEKNRNTAVSLIDPTALRNVFHYMDNRYENINCVVIVQDGYDLAEVVSPLMVPNDNDDSKTSDINGMDPEEYLKQLLTNGVIRMVFPDEIAPHGEFAEFMDKKADYDHDGAYAVILLPPMYWIQSMNKKWE